MHGSPELPRFKPRLGATSRSSWTQPCISVSVLVGAVVVAILVLFGTGARDILAARLLPAPDNDGGLVQVQESNIKKELTAAGNVVSIDSTTKSSLMDAQSSMQPPQISTALISVETTTVTAESGAAPRGFETTTALTLMATVPSTTTGSPDNLPIAQATHSLNLKAPGVCKPTASCLSRQVTKAGRKIFHCRGGYDWFWRDYPTWEPGTFNVFNKFASGQVVLDIGGWIGPTALWNAHSAEVVIVLEPTEKAFGELCSNVWANVRLAKKVVAIQAAVDAQDRTVRITNRGDSMDRFLEATTNVRAITISTLLAEQPILERTGFVKIDTEGYERVIVPALADFFQQKKPVAYVSLHPMFISHEQVQQVVDHLKAVFPYLYEQDMRTPFNSKRRSYTEGEHGGTDVVCTWRPLQ